MRAPLSLGEIMGANHHGRSLSGETFDAPPDLVPADGIETVGRLIEENQLGEWIEAAAS